MGLSAGGLASGLDVGGMTQQLVAAERAPKEQRINQQKQKLDVQLSSYGQIKSAVSSMEDLIKKFEKEHSFSSQKATSSESSYVGIKTDELAKSGIYSIEVLALAKNYKISSVNSFSTDPKASLGEGNLKISVGDKMMSLSINKDESNLSRVVKAINNASDNPGVTATVINDNTGAKIVFSTKQTGEKNTIKIDASSMSGELSKLEYDPSNPDANKSEMVRMQNSQDAKIRIDGFSTISNESNTFENTIEGVTLDIKKLTGTVGSGNPETDDIDVKNIEINIKDDSGKAKSAFEELVNSYNDLFDTVDGLTKYNLNTEQGGPLVGDSLARSLVSQMRNLFNSPIDIDGKSFQLSDFGITTDRDGKIEIDEDDLNDAIKKDFSSFTKFFDSSELGFNDKAQKLLKSYIGIDGSITSKEKGLESQMDRLNDDMSDLNERMKAYEERTYKQFSAMDAAIGKMNNELNTMMSLMVFK